MEEMCNEAKQILQNVYLDIINNPKKYKKQHRYEPSENEKKIDKLKKTYNLGRNSLCCCGSNKKFKNCCGKTI